ncbi:hypothetical protein [Streptomyces sp. NPDC021562]|uniref:hypothetical protein n=1 Tax=Streptomyces sp. NPDC021562 TaxID=3155121 RepID=UPI0010497506
MTISSKTWRLAVFAASTTLAVGGALLPTEAIAAPAAAHVHATTKVATVPADQKWCHWHCPWNGHTHVNRGGTGSGGGGGGGNTINITNNSTNNVTGDNNSLGNVKIGSIQPAGVLPGEPNPGSIQPGQTRPGGIQPGTVTNNSNNTVNGNGNTTGNITIGNGGG